MSFVILGESNRWNFCMGYDAICWFLVLGFLICATLISDSPSLPPHLDLFGISEQIQEKAEPPEFPTDFSEDIRIPGVEPLPADRPGSPASSLTTTEEESATESCTWEKVS